MCIEKKQDMYNNISNLLGMYAYTKNKVNIKPHVKIKKDMSL